MVESKTIGGTILSRIFIDEEGNLIITDLWEEIQEVIRDVAGRDMAG